MKPIALAVVLLITGSVLLTFGFLHLRGHIYSKDGAVSFSCSNTILREPEYPFMSCLHTLNDSQGWGLVTLGFLTFTPGKFCPETLLKQAP